jgi:hypothetical protein
MLALIVLVAAAAGAWRLSYWPFDRSYKYLPKYGDSHRAKPASASGTKPSA